MWLSAGTSRTALPPLPYAFEIGHTWASCCTCTKCRPIGTRSPLAPLSWRAMDRRILVQRGRVSAPDAPAPYWSRAVVDLGSALGSGPGGLTAAQAAERLVVVGRNLVEDSQRLGPLRLLWRQVESPLVLVLIFAPPGSLRLAHWGGAGT